VQLLAGMWNNLWASILSGASNAWGSLSGMMGFASGGVVGHYAEGGPNKHPISIVGERGPEAVALPAGTRVLSHSDMMQAVSAGASGGGGGGQTININSPLIQNATISDPRGAEAVVMQIFEGLKTRVAAQGGSLVGATA